MRVLHLLRALRVGGLENVVVNLVNGLAREGVQCHLGCLIEPGEWMGRVSPAGVWVGSLEQVGKLRAIASLCRYVRRESIGLLHSHNSQAHIIGTAASLLTGVPLVHTKHGQNWPDDPVWVWKSRQISRFTRRIVAVSADIARIVTDIEKVPARKVTVIVNGIDTEAFGARSAEHGAGSREKLGIDADAFVVGSVGRLAWEKNYELLARAFAALAREAPESLLVLVGDGPYEQRIRDAAAAVGLEKRCILAGKRDNVAEWLSAFDVFCLSSLTEGTSITLLEAGASGLPAVVTAVGGNAEIVQDGVTGRVVPTGDADALAAALIGLHGDPARRQAMGAAAGRRIQARYSVERMVGDYLSVYATVVGERRMRTSGATAGDVATHVHMRRDMGDKEG
jgi:sugar transferase (PEP-CTERM/EpsH1 system associated)